MTSTASRGRRSLCAALIAFSASGVGACGGADALTEAEYKQRLQAIDRRESQRFERLAQQAMRLRSTQVLTDPVRRGMREVAAGSRKAADELDRLEPPPAAAAATGELVATLRERADAFARAASQPRMTFERLEAEGTIQRTGDRLDRTFAELRDRGLFTPAAE